MIEKSQFFNRKLYLGGIPMHHEAGNADAENVGAKVALRAVLRALSEAQVKNQNNLATVLAIGEIRKDVAMMQVLAENDCFVQQELARK